MKLSVNTELGEFAFNFSQASVIYLLGLMQRIEDEGEQAYKTTKTAPVKEKEIVSKKDAADAPEELVFPPKKEDPAEELPFPEVMQEEEPEDFGTLLEEYEKKNKREWNSTGLAVGPVGGKYKGFLLIKCEHCGETRGFCAKQPIDEYKCNSCGEKTKLKDLRRLFMDCECGRHSKYYTNETAEVVTHNCIECGSPVDMMLNSRRTAYISIRGGQYEKRHGRI